MRKMCQHLALSGAHPALSYILTLAAVVVAFTASADIEIISQDVFTYATANAIDDEDEFIASDFNSDGDSTLFQQYQSASGATAATASAIWQTDIQVQHSPVLLVVECSSSHSGTGALQSDPYMESDSSTRTQFSINFKITDKPEIARLEYSGNLGASGSALSSTRL